MQNTDKDKGDNLKKKLRGLNGTIKLNEKIKISIPVILL